MQREGDMLVSLLGAGSGDALHLEVGLSIEAAHEKPEHRQLS
jgi:hypothetical protein